MPEPITTPDQPLVAEPIARGAVGWVAPVAMAVAVLALLGAGGVYWHMQTRMMDLELQLARRIGEFDDSSRQARAAAKEARSVLEDLNVRLSALENRAQDTQSQQLALAAMYQDLARGQDERVLADVEQSLLLAQQQLQLAGNVRAALLGLEATQDRLTRLEKPQFSRLREAIARDEERLKLLPAADVSGINGRLDSLMQGVDQLKLEIDSEPAKNTSTPAKGGPMDWMGRLGRETWQEVKELVRIRRLDHPEMPLLSPSQTYFLRQNLKLRLLSARLAALQRDEVSYRSDLVVARQWVAQYFSHRDPLTDSMQQSLKALESTPVTLKGADISDSLKALRALRRDKG